MKVIFLVNSMNGPSTRYRVLQYLPYLKKGLGHQGLDGSQWSPGEDTILFLPKGL